MTKSFCKINLSLRVLKKLKTGLHDIQSNTMLLNLHDIVKVNRTKRKKDVIFFKGKFKKLVNKSKNSVSDTMYLLRRNGLIKKEEVYKIVVNKKIPVFSGLGGGSSNAAFRNLFRGDRDLVALTGCVACPGQGAGDENFMVHMRSK